VGKFTSPHLIYIRDSIYIDGVSLSADDYERYSQHVRNLSDEHSIDASSFELLTATALYAFEEARVDVVVLEVGMGGRLDATNALRDEFILISVITAIDLDHQAFLGSTVREIALEKAGIIRHRHLIVLGDQIPENETDVLSSVQSVALQKCATLIRATPMLGDDEGALLFFSFDL
jgi:folylpolyglutamate synthase/dihydrofolate synthase